MTEAASWFGLIIAAFVMYRAPWAVVYGPAWIALFALSVYRLEAALALVPLFAPYFMQPRTLGHLEFSVSELVFVTCCGAFAVRQVRTQTRTHRTDWERLVRSPLVVPVLLLVTGSLLASLAAADRHLAVRGFREWIAEPVVYAALLQLTLRRVRDWWILFAAVVLAGVSSGVIGLVQYAAGLDLTQVPGTTIQRIKAAYGSPDNLGLLLDRVVPVWLAVVLFAPIRRNDRVVVAAAGIVLVPALYLTGSRGAEVGVALVTAAFVAMRFRWGRWIVVAGALALLVALGVKAPAVRAAFTSGHANTVQRRLDIWDSSWRMVREHPLLGIGPDNFHHYYAPRSQGYMPCSTGLGYMKPRAADEPCQSHPHNLLLDFWLSSGIAGAVALIVLQGWFWRTVLLLRSRFAWGAERTLLLATGGAMAASLVHGLVDNFYFLPDLSMLFWCLCGAVVFLQRSEATQRV